MTTRNVPIERGGGNGAGLLPGGRDDVVYLLNRQATRGENGQLALASLREDSAVQGVDGPGRPDGADQ